MSYKYICIGLESKLQSVIRYLAKIYSIPINMQKISSIHLFILEIQQILEPHYLIDNTQHHVLTIFTKKFLK